MTGHLQNPTPDDMHFRASVVGVDNVSVKTADLDQHARDQSPLSSHTPHPRSPTRFFSA